MHRYIIIKKNKMIITKKIIRVAQSLGIIIDKPIIEAMKLKEGEFITVNIERTKISK